MNAYTNRRICASASGVLNIEEGDRAELSRFCPAPGRKRPAQATGKARGNCRRVALEDVEATAARHSDDLLALGEAIEVLSHHARPAAVLVKLRYFAGLSVERAGSGTIAANDGQNEV